MKILVSGANGHIGSTLCRALCEKGHTVTAFVRKSSSLRTLQNLPLEYAFGDLTDESSVFEAVSAKPEVIFHLGAQKIGSRPIERLQDINISGTRRILQAALHYGVNKVVAAGSAYALGVPAASGDTVQELINENHCWNVRPDEWSYAWSKYMMEREVQLAVVYGLDVSIVNPTLVVGEGDARRRATSFLVRMKKQPPQNLWNGGLNIIHVDDVVTGLVGALERGKRGERYLLSGTNVSYKELLPLLADIIGFKAPAVTIPDSLAASSVCYQECVPEFFYLGLAELPAFAYAFREFYYDKQKSRLELRLPHTCGLRESLERSWSWFTADESARRLLTGK